MHGAAQLGKNAACDPRGPFFESRDPETDATHPTRAPSNGARGKTTAARRPKNRARVSVRTAREENMAAHGIDSAARPTSEHAHDPLPPAIARHSRAHDPNTAASAVRLSARGMLTCTKAVSGTAILPESVSIYPNPLTHRGTDSLHPGPHQSSALA